MAETIERETSRNDECSAPTTHDLDEVVDIIISDFNGDTLAFFESVRARTTKPPPMDVLEAALARKFAKVA
jgi:hypothetical protein